MIRYVFIITVALFGCVSRTMKSDSTTRQYVAEPDREYVMSEFADSMCDSSTVINFIDKFEDTSELYVDLFSKESFNYDSYQQLTNKTDSLIFDDDEIRRSRLPVAVAKVSFDLCGLDQIKIFDSANKHIANGLLSRIEYYEDMIESKFIGVYKTDKTTGDEAEYFITDGEYDFGFKNTNYKNIQNDALTNKLKLALALKRINRSAEHLKSESGNEVISFISGDDTSYIIEQTNGTLNYLYKGANETILNVHVIPMQIKGKPILLVKAGQPETDMLWTSLLVFDGTSYQVIIHNRIRL